MAARLGAALPQPLSAGQGGGKPSTEHKLPRLAPAGGSYSPPAAFGGVTVKWFLLALKEKPTELLHPGALRFGVKVAGFALLYVTSSSNL